tara:strand:- start:158 stop:373 length:216 start_codon:yes stop_codon:yes gene_type:complete
MIQIILEIFLVILSAITGGEKRKKKLKKKHEDNPEIQAEIIEKHDKSQESLKKIFLIGCLLGIIYLIFGTE